MKFIKLLWAFMIFFCLCLTGCTTSKTSDNNISVPFSPADITHRPYIEVVEELEELGFTNITTETMEYVRWAEGAEEGLTVSIYFGEEWDYEKGDSFSSDIPIKVVYLIDNFLFAPISSDDCQGLPYEVVVKKFTEAGFTNVIATPYETETNDSIEKNTVAAVNIYYNLLNYVDEFDESSEFNPGNEIIVYYWTFIEPTTEAIEETPDISTDNSKNTQMVWITDNGSKYHSKSGCSNMDNPYQITKEDAQNMGYEPCKRCH